MPRSWRGQRRSYLQDHPSLALPGTENASGRGRWRLLVGPARFELTTSCAPCKRATRLRYGPREAPHITSGLRRATPIRPADAGDFVLAQLAGVPAPAIAVLAGAG